MNGGAVELTDEQARTWQEVCAAADHAEELAERVGAQGGQGHLARAAMLAADACSAFADAALAADMDAAGARIVHGIEAMRQAREVLESLPRRMDRRRGAGPGVPEPRPAHGD